MPTSHDNPDTFIRETANDRFKEKFGNWFWGSVAAAVLVHFLVFAFFPDMTAADSSFSTDELEAIDLPDDIEIPPPPQPIARPATPVISASADISEDITIAPTTFEDNPIEDLPPPPPASGDALSQFQAFSPSMVRPEVRNRAELVRRMQRLYPSLLRDAGIGGTTVLALWIDETGQVVRSQIGRSSGHSQLDEAALQALEGLSFTPAMNRDRAVPVRLSWAITWQAN